MNVVVTGGHGFVGRATCHALVAAGHEAKSLDRAHGVDLATTDIAPLLSGADRVIHLAGVLGTAELFDAPWAAVEANVGLTLRVLEACAATGAGYVGITMPTVGWPSLYQATKRMCQDVASCWHENEGVPVSHVRAYNAFGVGQAHGAGHPRKIVPSFATQAWAGLPIEVWGDGEQTVDLVHVDDVGRMLVDACDFGNDEIFDAATGQAMTVNAVAALVNEIARNDAGVTHLPMRKGERPNTNIVADGDGWDMLGWHPWLSGRQFSAAVESYRVLVAA